MADADTAAESAPALKEIFNAARIRRIAKELKAIYPAFDSSRFIKLCLADIDDLSLMQRLRRISESLHETIPKNYENALVILRELAPRLDHSFAALVLSDYVAFYGADHFDASMDALKFFTTFGSSEFAVRHFLRRDLKRTLRVMEKWSRDESEHVRRLASEGSRPRLPWSFRIEELVRDPSPSARILENLKTDSSLYVRKSVANHLNDITKDHPKLALDRIESWDLSNSHSAWIAKHALRSLIKKGDRRALTIIGAGKKASVELTRVSASPATLKLGDRVTLSMTIRSTSKQSQRLVIDYAVHYVKKAGGTSPKVFKLKTIELPAGEEILVARTQAIQNFTTRTHYAGKHEIDIFVNGDCLGKAFFVLND